MYIPSENREHDLVAVEQLIRENGFAILATNGSNGLPLATHIPLERIEREGKWFLHGHIAAANPQRHTLKTGSQALCIFQGAHAYISPSWYDAPNVPTWNYVAAQLSGTVRILSEAELRASLSALTRRYEEATAQQPILMEQLSESYIAAHIRAIVGFEIAIETIEGKAKLSQNRNDASYRNIIWELRNSGYAPAIGVAEAMEAKRPLS